ncbi:hypothetical protein [Quadrisphaera setariae]|uniref:DUF4214 domain-containing protein n=1 Tax=Quadrisphaera setariae TaxID=2593304 RepID=A0A5C8ZEB5_9ACTN|nr:hypothetical protein [Quadrisphaera setariae]TXR55639.1 hypothetical protein FMM08_12390 [Quadrisphaera setariae]
MTTTMTTSKHLSRRGALAAAGAMAGAAMGLATAAPASAAPSDRTLVDAWHRDFLQRGATDADVDRYTSFIAYYGAIAAADDLTKTREHAEHQVGQLYGKHLQRQPDPGAAHWIDGVAEGRFPLEWVNQNILASPEYAALWAKVYRSSKPSYTAGAWINTLLNRRASADETASWGRRIQKSGRLGALRDLYYTDEAVYQRINGHYLELLGRPVDGGGYSYWYGLETKDDRGVQVRIAASPEYRERSGDR